MDMLKFFRAFLIASMVAVTGCVGFAATRAAGIRRVEASRLRTCVQGRCQWTKECIEESAVRCRAQGLEATCGTDEIFTQTLIRCSP